MSKKDEALKLALEALEKCDSALAEELSAWDIDPPLHHVLEASNACGPAITAIREALAEQPAQQEPVVWMYINRSTHETSFQKQMRSFVDHSQWKEVPLYSEPLANHEFQCVCGAVWCGDEMVHLPDKRPQPSKPWAGLTEEERRACTQSPFTMENYLSIEAKLREKNNG